MFTIRHLVAAACAAGIVVGLSVGVAGSSAAAGTSATSDAASRFLSGSLLLDSVNLDDVLALAGVTASSETGQPTDTATSPLDLTALGALEVTVPGGVHIPLSQFLSLGAVNQYAQARPDGTARAAAGAVSDSGAVDTRPSSDFPADADIDLAGLLGAPAADVFSTARLTLGGITAVAAVDAALGPPATTCADLSAPEDCRDYTLVRGGFDFTSPLVGDLVTTVGTALDTVSGTVDSAISSGLITGLLNGVTSVLGDIDDVLIGVSLVSNDLSVTIDSDLRTALHSVLTDTLSDGLVSINLTTGDIHVDLNALTGGLNGLPPNTEVLTSDVINDLVARIGALLDGFGQDVEDTVTTVLNAEAVTINGGVCLLEALSVCTAGLDIDYSGTIAGLVSGASALTVSGTGLLTLTGSLLTTVLDALQMAVSGVPGPILTTALGDVTDALTPAISTLTSALDPVLVSLTSVLSLTANVQESGSTAGSYREVALRAALGSGTVATVDLARAEVSATAVTAPTTTAARSSTAGGTTTAATSAPATSTPSTTTPHTPSTATPSTPAPGRPGDPNIDTGMGANASAASGTWWTVLGVLVLGFAALVAGSAVRQARRRS